MKRMFWIFVRAAEVMILAAMLLADFGVIGSNTDPLSARGIMLHITAVAVIIVSFIGMKKS